MSKDNNIPLCYQITVSNIIKIGDKVMSVSVASYRISMLSLNQHKKTKILGNPQSFMADLRKKIQIFLGLSSLIIQN